MDNKERVALQSAITMDNKRDPRKDPRVGDVVLAKFTEDGGRVGWPLAVQGLCGNVIAYTEGPFAEVQWMLSESWCEPSSPVEEWEVLHVAD